jgi:hypothetical protein
MGKFLTIHPFLASAQNFSAPLHGNNTLLQLPVVGIKTNSDRLFFLFFLLWMDFSALSKSLNYFLNPKFNSL